MNRQEKLEWLARNVNEWPNDDECVTTNGSDAFFLPYTPLDGDSWFTRQEWLSTREKLQNKPSWKDAPDWANWLGQCAGGRWEWYGDNDRPPVHVDQDCFAHSGIGVGTGNSGEVLGDWRDTLEKRAEMPSGINIVREHEDIQPSKPQDNSWHERGELPPVGTVCEVMRNMEWAAAEILKTRVNSSGMEVVAAMDVNDFTAFWSADFRPLRTEREKAIDEMVSVIKESIATTETTGPHKIYATALYEAGYRKQ